MNDNTELLLDRIDDLEDKIIDLHEQLEEQEEDNKNRKCCVGNMIFFIFPLTLILLLSLGLDIQFQSNNHQIRYNNDNLTQLVLSLVTVASGVYTLKKNREQAIIKRNKREPL